MAELSNPHDAFFKQFLAKPEVAEDFLRQHLPADVVSLLNLSALALQKDTFIDEELRAHFSDLLYRVPLGSGENAFIYVLFEHKSYPDRYVAFQVLRYMVQIWDKELRATSTFSPIIPLVVYHGKVRWTIPTNFGALFDVSNTLRQFIPEFQYQLTDLSALSDTEIRGHIWARVFQLILKHIFDERLGERLPGILALAFDLAQRQTSLEMIATILRYVSQAGVGASIEDIRRAVMAVLPQEGGVLMETVAEQWIKQGLDQGLEQGRAEGESEAQRRTILRILHRRFALSAEEQITLAEQLAKITNLTALDQLVDHALEAVLFTDFKTRLQSYLDQP